MQPATTFPADATLLAASERRLVLKRKNKGKTVVTPKYSKLNDSFENIQVIGNDVEITGIRPVHPRDRLKRKLKNLTKKRKTTVDISEVVKKTWSAVDLSDLKKKPYINFDINLDVTDKNKRKVYNRLNTAKSTAG